MTSVALGEPGTPLICWAGAGRTADIPAEAVSTVRPYLIRLLRFMVSPWSISCCFDSQNFVSLCPIRVRLYSISGGQIVLLRFARNSFRLRIHGGRLQVNASFVAKQRLVIHGFIKISEANGGRILDLGPIGVAVMLYRRGVKIQAIANEGGQVREI